MQHKHKKISEATTEELLYFATSLLNLEVSASMSHDELFAIISEAQPETDMIFVLAPEEDQADELEQNLTEAPAEPEPVINNQGLKGSFGKGDPRAKIFIPVVDTGVIGSSDVAVGVNGVVWQLKRGVELDVPWRVVEALMKTEQNIIRHGENGEVIENKAMRFAINILERPSKEAIDAWHAQTQDQFCP